ncbi:LuxR C-terminal-related transcriptional regulator [Flavobacterium sp. SM2513]|uniref:LuxR C-terminal-related transcriptional regulator n=1 Tax=Flavobacterium sp. SM2513 TaxID=3424766 RepID=UPI003D7FA532
MINISIADNQPVVMHGIKSFFKNHSAISISDTIYHLHDIDNSLKTKIANILMIDIDLEGLHSIKSLRRILRENPATKLLIYTCASEKLFGVTSLKVGAAGFISKNEPLKKIEQAILKIAEGKTVFSDSVHKAVLTTALFNEEERIYRKLSLREIEVLRYLVKGKKNNEISELLDLNEKTISTYKLRLLNKLHVTNLIDLVDKAKTLEIL